MFRFVRTHLATPRIDAASARRRGHRDADRQILVSRHRPRLSQRRHPRPPRPRRGEERTRAVPATAPARRAVGLRRRLDRYAPPFKPDSIPRGHRGPVRRTWTHRRTNLGGRPTIPAEAEARIVRLARENPRRGHRRIQGGLGEPGHAVSAPTARVALGRHRVPSAPQRRRAAGVRCARKRVARLMRAAGLVGCRRRRRIRTTVADPTRTPAPTLVARDSTAPAADRLWIGDSTCVPTGESWRSLAVLLDAHSRRVVGWAMADHLRAEPATDALAMAPGRRRPAAGLVRHTDRGGHHIATAYRAALAARAITRSMSRAGECLDNAMAERCCSTRKAELAGGSAPLADTRRGAAGDPRVARSLVQPAASPLGARLPQSGQLCGAAVVVPASCLTLSCPCERVKPTRDRRVYSKSAARPRAARARAGWAA